MNLKRVMMRDIRHFKKMAKAILRDSKYPYKEFWLYVEAQSKFVLNEYKNGSEYR